MINQIAKCLLLDYAQQHIVNNRPIELFTITPQDLVDMLTSEKEAIQTINFGLDPINVACKIWQTKRRAVESEAQTRDEVLVRQVVMWYYKTYKKYSLSKAGDVFKKDHSTVVHACKAVQNSIDTDKHFRAKLEHFLKYMER